MHSIYVQRCTKHEETNKSTIIPKCATYTATTNPIITIKTRHPSWNIHQSQSSTTLRLRLRLRPQHTQQNWPRYVAKINPQYSQCMMGIERRRELVAVWDAQAIGASCGVQMTWMGGECWWRWGSRSTAINTMFLNVDQRMEVNKGNCPIYYSGCTAYVVLIKRDKIISVDDDSFHLFISVW